MCLNFSKQGTGTGGLLAFFAVELRTGTSGFSYKEWKGSFYPEKIAPGDMLAYYAEHFSAVEINNTFYRMPKREMLASWAEQVPEGFTFVLKASRRITHMKRLVDAGDEVDYLYRAAEVLGEKRGPVLFQLPPFLRKDTERLRGFLEVLPRDHRAALEFRHNSWQDAEVHELLAEFGAALCVADTGDPEAMIPTLEDRGTFGYLRLRDADYDDAALGDWVQRVRGANWGSAFVFFKHEDEGKGPAQAARFSALFDTFAPKRVAARKAPARTKKQRA